MESSRRDLLNDMAEHTPILKNNHNTYHSRFGFISKTGKAFPKTGFCFYCADAKKKFSGCLVTFLFLAVRIFFSQKRHFFFLQEKNNCSKKKYSRGKKKLFYHNQENIFLASENIF